MARSARASPAPGGARDRWTAASRPSRGSGVLLEHFSGTRCASAGGPPHPERSCGVLRPGEVARHLQASLERWRRRGSAVRRWPGRRRRAARPALPTGAHTHPRQRRLLGRACLRTGPALENSRRVLAPNPRREAQRAQATAVYRASSCRGTLAESASLPPASQRAASCSTSSHARLVPALRAPRSPPSLRGLRCSSSRHTAAAAHRAPPGAASSLRGGSEHRRGTRAPVPDDIAAGGARHAPRARPPGGRPGRP